MKVAMVGLVAAVLVVPAWQAQAQNLVSNGGFENGVRGWTLVAGGYNADTPAMWAQNHNRGRLVADDVHGGKAALLLNAVGFTNEVDSYSLPMAVTAGHAYRLRSWVKQTAGDSGYKVTIDWQDGQGKHISYDNDWRGDNKPTKFTEHGGVFTAPAGAARAVIILGVQKEVAALFDDISLTDLGRAEPLNARPRHDGDGSIVISGPGTVPACGNATWHITYTCGKSGLPVGGAIDLRRWPLSLEWSKPQGGDPKAPGYVKATGPRNAEFDITSGRLQDIIVKVGWPALQPGDKVDIVVGDTSGGSPGMKVQGRLAKLRWVAASDCNADGKFATIGKVTGGGFQIVPGPPVQALVVAPGTAVQGQTASLVFELRDAGNNVVPTPAGELANSLVPATDAAIPGLPKKLSFPAGQPAREKVMLKFPASGLYHLGVAPHAGLATPTTKVVVGGPTRGVNAGAGPMPRAYLDRGTAVLENDAMRVVLPRNAAGAAGGLSGYGYAAIYVRRGSNWALFAAMPSVGRILWATRPKPKETLIYAQAAKETRADGRAELLLTGSVTTPTGKKWPFTARLTIRRGDQQFDATYTLTPTSADPILAFYGPELYAGDGSFGATKHTALFPGLEYLTADEDSSSDQTGVAWDLRERWSPHPYKVTVPMMAVGGDKPGAEGMKATVGMIWNPREPWDGTHMVDAPVFWSPNRRAHHPDHYMGLFVPYLAADFKENLGHAPKPYTPAVGTKLTVSADIFALANTDDVTDAVAYYAGHHKLPTVEPPRTWPAELALCATGYMHTGFIPSGPGWAASVGWKPARDPFIADRILMSADLSGDAKLLGAARAQVATVLGSTFGGSVHSLRSGDPLATLDGLHNAAVSLMESQSREGYWTFAQVYSTEGDRADLAAPNAVALGTCVNNLYPILRYALATGDQKALKAGLLGLKYCDRFTKPSGSESWEVPLACPNLRAAALAVDCYVAAYQLTGQKRYLDRARYWARAGLAFIYQWRAPDRPVMPGASISVMGTTFYTWGWFGNAVQWVGLVYAESLQHLAAYDTSLPWKDVARMITISAMRQQKTKGAPCGHVGYFPDSYSVVEGHQAYEWCISPAGIVDNVLGLMGLSETFDTKIARDGALAVHLTTVAGVKSATAKSTDGAFTAALHYLAGQKCNAMILGITAPAGMTWDGAALPRLASWKGDQPGWMVDWRTGAVLVRLDFARADGVLVVRGVKPKQYKTPEPSATILNGGFEKGTEDWTVEPEGSIDRVHPHSGKAALALNAPDPAHEVQATSQPMIVKGGEKYRLSSWVWQFEGNGSYKVTIDWCKANGAHIKYDNDWAGNNKPRQYTEHGGVFTAPEDAASAVIILGCRGCKCFFDDISLKLAK